MVSEKWVKKAPQKLHGIGNYFANNKKQKTENNQKQNKQQQNKTKGKKTLPYLHFLSCAKRTIITIKALLPTTS